MAIEQPHLNTEEAIIAHLEGLTIADNQTLRNRDFSYIDGMPFDKPPPRFADEAPGQRFTQAEAVNLGKMLCQTYPEYDPKIIDMVTTLGDGEKFDVDKITKAHTFLTFERNGIRPGMTTVG